ncbi:TonB-dependent receptor [Rhizorhabdus dicambivorans]|uniref:TonB-dependent receptor n=1 Tax=Rhizorhabdus dicambivorans TaxID=1850238 RepID=UPI00083126A6|nr:TonB-dependent receptor [Rhizorhabdus dicambivorans]
MKKVYQKAFVSAGTLALALAGRPAVAQSVAGETSATAAETGVADIIVTARKRSERLQDVPVAITAISNDAFAARSSPNIKDVSKISPGLFYRGHDVAKPSLYIRGIGTRGFTGEADPSIGTFIDGVYIGRFGSQVQDLDNVERVEVLKGPQGTLFGRNTIGGALNIVTTAPTDSFRARIKGSYGFNQEFGGEQFTIGASVSGPIGDGVRGLVSVSHSESDGPAKVVNSGQHANGGGRTTLRARLAWDMTDRLTFDLNGDYYRTNGASTVFRSNSVGGRRPNVLGARAGLIIPPTPTNPYLVYGGPDQGLQQLHGGGVGLTASYSGDDIDFTSISAYRGSYANLGNDVDGTVFFIQENPYKEKARQFSQEVRFSSKRDGELSMGGRLDWTVGAFFFDERSTQHNYLRFGTDFASVALPAPTGTGGVPIFSDAGARVRTRSYAAFGTVGFKISDSLKLEAGLRYTHDRKRDTISNFTSAPGIYSSNFGLELGKSWSSVDPSLTLSYNVSRDILTYVSYSTGFKSGTFQVLPSTLLVASQIANPERIKAFQGGVKSDLFDRKLRFNLAGFYYRYRDIQVQRTTLIPGSTTQTVTSVTNGALSKIYGFEAEGQLVASSNLRFDYGYSFLHAKYADYLFRPGISFTGNYLPRAPKHTANVGAVLDVPTSFGKITARASGNYVASYFFESSNSDAGVREPSHFTADASVDLVTGPYSAGVFVRNLTGERQRNNVLNIAPFRLLETWDYRRVIGIRAAMSW